MPEAAFAVFDALFSCLIEERLPLPKEIFSIEFPLGTE